MKPKICGKCALPGHDMWSCTNEVRECVNCKRNGLDDLDHFASDRKCPIFIFNQKIKEVMAFHNKDFNSAKELLEQNHGRNPPVQVKTYSEAVKRNDLALLVQQAKIKDDEKQSEKRKKAIAIRREREKKMQEEAKALEDLQRELQENPRGESSPAISEERRAELLMKVKDRKAMMKLQSQKITTCENMECENTVIKRKISEKEANNEEKKAKKAAGEKNNDGIEDQIDSSQLSDCSIIPETQESLSGLSQIDNNDEL